MGWVCVHWVSRARLPFVQSLMIWFLWTSKYFIDFISTSLWNTDGSSSLHLYSCGGEGAVFQNDPSNLQDTAVNVTKLIQATNNIQVGNIDRCKVNFFWVESARVECYQSYFKTSLDHQVLCLEISNWFSMAPEFSILCLKKHLDVESNNSFDCVHIMK